MYSLEHITGKVANSRLSDPASMYGDKAEFLRFSVALTKSRESAEFKEFYRFLAQCFEDADQARQGRREPPGVRPGRPLPLELPRELARRHRGGRGLS